MTTMTARTTAPAPSRGGSSVVSQPRQGRRLPTGAAFYLQASIVLALLAGSSAPTPLYAIYQAKWGFSPITTTIVFGVYALAVLTSLLTVGRLSDHVGRRPVLLGALGIQVVTMVVFATAGAVPQLMLARVLQGLSTGAAVGAVGAGLLDLDRARGTIANAVAPVTGTATGALGSALLIQFLPSPTRTVYFVLLAGFVLQAVGVAFMPESVTPKPGALRSLRPEFGVPAAARAPMFVAAPMLVAVWSLAGLYGALGPAVVGLVVGSHSVLLGGLSLFVLAAGGGLTALVLHKATARALMFIGVAALFGGVGITLLGIHSSSAAAFFIGTAVAGIGFGAGFQGALRTVVPLAQPHERAGLLSTMYVISYLAMGLPAVVAGFVVVHTGSVRETALGYGAAVMTLALVAFAGLLRRGPRAL